MSFFRKDKFMWFLLIVLPPVGLIVLWHRKRDCYNSSKLVALSSIFVVWFSFIILYSLVDSVGRYPTFNHINPGYQKALAHEMDETPPPNITASQTPTSPPLPPTLEPTPMPTPSPTPEIIEEEIKVVIMLCDKKAEVVTIQNNSPFPMNLEGWELVSVKGNQRFIFPSVVVYAGESITVASGDAVGDLHWSTKNMWNNTKVDPAELYNAEGELMDRYE